MHRTGALSAFVLLAAATAFGQEQAPNPPAPVMVDTPFGQTVPVQIPAPVVSDQPYTPTTQPIVIPVPITVHMAPPPASAPRPAPRPAPAPAFPQQPPGICTQPNQACIPVDGRGPLPFDVPMDGPIRSTVLPPSGLAGYPVNPPPGQPGPDPFQPVRAPFGLPETDAAGGQRLTVPPPSIPYSLDSRGHPVYAQEPYGYQRSAPNQWPGYTPTGPQQNPAAPDLPRLAGGIPYNPNPYPAYPPQPAQPAVVSQPLPQPTYPGMVPTPIQGQNTVQPVPTDLNPAVNPGLTNPNTPVQLVTPAQVQEALYSGARMTVLDVRGELVRDVIGHIPNDVHVDLNPRETFPARAHQALPDRSIPVVVYCNDGINSSQAANMLANMGYKVYLMGIYTGWGSQHAGVSPQACYSCLQP